MSQLAIAAATPHLSLATLLHENIHGLLHAADPRLRMPRSYAVVRRSMSVLRKKMRQQ